MSVYFLEREGGEEPGEDAWVLILFVAGRSPNSQLAQQNLEEIVLEHLQGRCSVQIVDILENPKFAIERGILVAPTLLRISPQPDLNITGNLEDRQKVLAALGLVRA